MCMRRKIVGALFLAASLLVANAQSGTNSPYSQFGLGVMADRSNGPGRGMNGLGLGYHEHNQVNPLNPASYATVDSLSFIFDVGLSGQLTNFEEGGKRINAKNADFEYAVGAFRLARHFGFSFGVLPYSNVGYSYTATARVGSSSSDYYTSTYTGKGGIHQVYVGAGWEPFKGFALGVNVGYLWGGYDRTLTNVYSDSHVNTNSKIYSADVKNYTLDVGVQFSKKVSAKDMLTVAATYGLGHKIGGDPTCKVISYNPQTSIADTTSYPKSGKMELEIPSTYGAGLMWYHAEKVKVGVDYTLMKWTGVKFPEYKTDANGAIDYSLQSGLFNNRHKLTLGAEICPRGTSGRKYAGRIRYRAGVSYATPYLNINGHDGPKELSASVGFGLPIVNRWNNRSILNISAQYVRQESKIFITENTFRINIGLTFNERWFDKWKVE